MRIIGIDPGISGAAVLNVDGRYDSHEFMPTIKLGKRSRVNAAALAGFVRGAEPDHIVIERVGAMPGQGVASMFSFGHSAGILEGIAAALGVPYELITPQKWKSYFGLLGTDKDAARAKAVQLFPQAPLARKKDLALADALLLSEFVRLVRSPDEAVDAAQGVE